MGLGMIRSFYHSKCELLLRYGTNERVSAFKLQKRVIWSMCGAGTGTFCRQLFKDSKILMVTSLYVFEVLCFLKKYKSAVQKNKQVPDHNPRTNMDLHIKTSSCINKEIQVFNRKLHKPLKDMHHVNIIDMNLTRNDFTQHGLHVNSSGKEKIAKKIGHNITNLLTSQNPPISLTLILLTCRI
jgi:hypothetical protein